MMKRWLSILTIVLVVGLFIVVGLVWKPWVYQAEALTKEAVEKAVLEQYPGEVIATTLFGDVYKMQLKTDTGLYALKVDSLNGEIVSLEMLTKNVVSVVENKEIETKNTATGGNPPTSGTTDNGTTTTTKATTVNTPTDKKPKDEPTKILTTEQATALSTKHVNGTVDDIVLRQSSKESYYLVEIDAVDGREVVVQVNALTGVIMSVIWDDKRNESNDLKNDDDKSKNDDDDER